MCRLITTATYVQKQYHQGHIETFLVSSYKEAQQQLYLRM